MVGLIPSQGVFEHVHRQFSASSVRADLCHQEDLVAANAPECPAQDGLRLAVVILPSVVEESDAGVDRLVNELHRFVQGRHIAEMMTTHSNSRNAHILASEFAVDHVTRSPRRRNSSLFCYPKGRDLLRS